ncbi:thiamine phosphate synthase [Candidatus Pelagibacter bacterium nBUS_25]|uniref:thiamine phosphate synthase n=1 Tax=Candidatus Pelagibacter bacterium nBUS_25 TaxID=3374187 RepID=UPI003EB8FD39
MHFNLFCFIDDFNFNLINNLPKTTSIIFRNYNNRLNTDSIIKTKNLCRKLHYKLYLANNIKLALELNLDGAYIPAHNRDFKINSYQLKKKFKLIGSAHNLKEIRTKELQKVDYLFLSSLFFSKKNKKELGIYRFLNLSKKTKKK